MILEEKKAEVLIWRRGGMSLVEIGRKLGITHRTVLNYLRKWGEPSGRSYGFITSFTNHQNNLLIGSLLGDGSLSYCTGSQNPHLSEGHGPEEKEYLEWKYRELGALVRQRTARRTIKSDGNLSFQMSSRTHPLLRPYYDLFYSRPDAECTPHIHKKCITQQVLDLLTLPSGELNWEALAIWFADDGTVQKNSRLKRYFRDEIRLLMGGWTDGEYSSVRNWFLEMGFSPTFPPSKWHDRGANCVMLSFSVSDSERLAKAMNSFLPDPIRWKFGTLLGEYVDTAPKARGIQKVTT